MRSEPLTPKVLCVLSFVLSEHQTQHRFIVFCHLYDAKKRMCSEYWKHLWLFVFYNLCDAKESLCSEHPEYIIFFVLSYAWYYLWTSLSHTHVLWSLKTHFIIVLDVFTLERFDCHFILNFYYFQMLLTIKCRKQCIKMYLTSSDNFDFSRIITFPFL